MNEFLNQIFVFNHLWNLAKKIHFTALISAAFNNSVESVRLLLTQKDIDINIKTI